jgi:hypothetical protein
MTTQKKETNRGLDRTPDAVLHGIALYILCVICNWLITHMLPHTLSMSRDDDLLGPEGSRQSTSPREIDHSFRRWVCCRLCDWRLS